MPIDARFWGVWLKGAFGAPITTEDTGVYTHEFQLGRLDAAEHGRSRSACPTCRISG